MFVCCALLSRAAWGARLDSCEPGVAVSEPQPGGHLRPGAGRATGQLHRLREVSSTRVMCCEQETLPACPLPLNAILFSRDGVMNTRMAGGCLVCISVACVSKRRARLWVLLFVRGDLDGDEDSWCLWLTTLCFYAVLRCWCKR